MIGLLLLTAGLVFHPVEPCRVMDTRVESIITCHPDNFGICTHFIVGPWGFIVAGDETREAFKDRGWASEFQYTFADQGGKPGGCGIPRDAKAVVLNAALGPMHIGSGHLRVWPHAVIGYHPFAQLEELNSLIELSVLPSPVVHEAEPSGNIPIPTQPPRASMHNWPGDHCERNFSVPSSIHCTAASMDFWTNSITVGLCDPETAPFNDCNEDIWIRPYGVHGGATRLIVDVYGYYSEQ